MSANIEAGNGLFFSQRLLSALVESGMRRDAAYRHVQRHAMRAWEEGLDFRELARADADVATRVDLDRVFTLEAFTAHVHTVFDRLRELAATRWFQSMLEALHVGSGKVRELYALGDDRLVLVASDRISTFDVVLPTEIPDKGRVLTGLSAFWFARTRHIVPNHLLALRDDGRSLECRRLEMLPVEIVVRGYLAGSGWTDYLERGAVGGTRLPAGSARVGPPVRADRHAGDEGNRGARRSTSRNRSRGSLRSHAVPRGARGGARRLPLCREACRSTAESSWRTPSSSSASTSMVS